MCRAPGPDVRPGKGERTEGKWTAAQLPDELKQLNAIVVGLGAQVGFNDDWLGVSELVTGYDTVRVKVTMGGYDGTRSAYVWQLYVHHRDGRRQGVTGGQSGLGATNPGLGASPSGQQSAGAAPNPLFRNLQRSSKVENGALIIEDSIEVKTSVFQKVSVDAKYWLDKNDDQAVAQVKLEESDW
jgi:hypothetical protein